MPREYRRKYKNNPHLAEAVIAIWKESQHTYIKDVDWSPLNLKVNSMGYMLNELGLCLLRVCPVCDRRVAANNGCTKYCSPACVAKASSDKGKEERLSVKNLQGNCKICNAAFLLNPKASRRKWVCSHACHLTLRNWAQSTIYSERRRKDAKKWAKEKGKEYGAAWRMKHKDNLMANQRKRRTGSYGYKYEVRGEAIKAGYRSAFEQALHGNMLSRNINPEYETHKLKWVDNTQHTYTPDFILKKKDGSLMFVEAKGYFDSKTRAKMLFVKKCNPDLDIRLLFQHPHTKLKKGSKTTYAKWADRHGFQWCGPIFSDAWAEELASA